MAPSRSKAQPKNESTVTPKPAPEPDYDAFSAFAQRLSDLEDRLAKVEQHLASNSGYGATS